MSRRPQFLGPPLNPFRLYAFPKGNLVLQMSTSISLDSRFLMSILPPPEVTQAEYDAAMVCQRTTRGVRQHLHAVVFEGDKIGDQMIKVCCTLSLNFSLLNILQCCARPPCPDVEFPPVLDAQDRAVVADALQKWKRLHGMRDAISEALEDAEHAWIGALQT